MCSVAQMNSLKSIIAEDVWYFLVLGFEVLESWSFLWEPQQKANLESVLKGHSAGALALDYLILSPQLPDTGSTRGLSSRFDQFT